MRLLIHKSDLDSDSGRVGSTTLLNLRLRLSDGVRATAMNPNSLRTGHLVVVVGETPVMGGGRVKRITPVLDGAETIVTGDGETQITVAEGGEVGTKVEGDGETKTAVEQGVGALPSLGQVAVDGAPPTGTMVLLIQPNRLGRVKPPLLPLRFRPHQITPGVHLTTHGARPTMPGTHPTMPGVHPVGVPQITLGGPPTKPHQMKPLMKSILARGRGRD